MKYGKTRISPDKVYDKDIENTRYLLSLSFLNFGYSIFFMIY